MTKEQILKEAMALSPRERDEVAEALWQSTAIDEFTPEQLAEIHRRAVAINTGQAQLIPGHQMMAELRQRYQC